MYELFFGLESLPLSIAFAESLFAYPVVLGIHLLALVFAVGLLGLADLRLMGVLLMAASNQPSRLLVAPVKEPAS